jgi:hypothetical protein
MNSSTHTVGTTRSVIVAADNIYRTVYLHVTGNGTVYLGGVTVTAANGMPTEKHAVPLAIDLAAGQPLYAIVAAETEEVRVLTPDVD